MSNFDSDSNADGSWEDRGELAWNEFDWERYLREQDDAIHRYLRFYEAARDVSNRIDDVAEQMGWGEEDWNEESEGDADDDEADDDEFDEDEIYTLHKNPIFIATKGIYLGLNRSWQALAGDTTKVPQPLAVALLGSLHRGEDQAVQAIHALDFGDFAMAVSLFKRALTALNATLALVNADAGGKHRHFLAWREEALNRIFDLREVWLRVIAECREELDQTADDES